MARITLEDVKSIAKAAYYDTVEMIKKVNTKAVHENRTALDKFSEDTEGNPLYNGNPIKGGGISDVSTEENNAIVKKSDGIYAEDLSDKVRELDNRSVIAETNNYCKLLMSNNQVAVLNDIIKYDKVVYSNNMEYNLSNYTIHLKAGRTYDLRCTILTGLVSGATVVRFFNKTTNEFIGNLIKSVSPNYNATECPNSSYSELYECKSDCDVCVQIVTMVGSQTIYNTVSKFEVVEVGRTIILDPVVYAQDHEINYYEFGMTSNYNILANNNGGKNIPFSSVISGDIPINADGTITLPANKRYKITLSNAILTGYSVLEIRQDGVRIGENTINYGNNATNITSSTAFAYSEVKTTDSVIGIYSTTTLTSTIMNQFFRLIVEEIKNPVVVEYTNLKEISNPLMSSQISQEAPIGTIIKYIGGNIPNYYLPCDGKIYLITDHLALFNVIGNEFGGDGITTFAVPNYTETPVDVTPIMTSNTAPSPYVASASSVYNNETRYYPYRAFNGTNVDINDAWLSAGIATPQYIMLDFGTPTTVNEVKMIANNSTASPKDFTVQGSNDGSSFTIIKTFSETSWVNNVAKTLSLGTSVTYRYFKVNITSNNGNSSYVGIGQLRFLNSATKDYIKSEATHYAVNQYGGFMMDTLWEGNALNNTTFILADSYKNYDIIYICCSYNNSFLGSSPFSVLSIKQGDYLCVDVPSIASTYADNTGRVRILSETSMTLTNATNISIYKILGIKGSIPTIIEGGVL